MVGLLDSLEEITCNVITPFPQSARSPINLLLATALAALGLFLIQAGPAVASSALSAPGITPLQANPTSVPSLSFLLSGDPGSTFACELDDAEDYGPCSSPLALGPLAEGHHTLRVVQVGWGGDVSAEAAVYSFEVDLTAPDAPGVSLFTPADALGSVSDTGSVTAQTSALATFSSINADVPTFNCSLDGTPEVECESPYTGGLSNLSEGLHTLVLTQTDEAGNVSPPSTLSWTVDTAAPADANWDSPFDVWTSSTTFRVTDGESLTWVLPPDSGTAIRAVCSVDAGPDENCDTAVSQDLTGLDDGAHSLRVKVVDEAGNASAGITASWTTDTTSPETPTIKVSSSEFTSQTTARVDFSSESDWVDLGLAPRSTFTCTLNGDDYTPCTPPVNLVGLEDGTNTFVVTETDRAGNESAPATVSWTVDTEAPEAVSDLESNRSGTTNQRNGQLTWSDTEPDVSAYCRLTRNGQPGVWNPCSSPKDVSNLPLGDIVFEVKLRDRAGNDSTPTEASWTVARLAVVTPPAIDVDTTTDLPVGTLVTAEEPEFSGAADAVSDTTAWQRCSNTLGSSCVTIAGTSGSPGSSSYTPAEADIGRRLRYLVVRTADDGSTVATASTVTGIVIPVVRSSPSINGLTAAFDGANPATPVPAFATALTAVRGTWTTGVGGRGTEYRWQRCRATVVTCASIVLSASPVTSWANQPTYVVRASDIGRRLRLLTGVNIGSGRYIWSASSLTSQVKVVAENTVAPSLVYSSGSVPQRSKSVSVRVGSWRYTFGGSYKYAWRSCTGSPVVCTSIAGATRSSYVPSSAIVARRLQVKVTYTGSDRTAVSVFTAISPATVN